MDDFRLPLRSDYDRNPGYKWYECCLCGTLYRRAMVHFDSGSVAPTEGETITGATSGDTGVLSRYVLVSGTFAAGDAVGIIEMTSPTGYDDGNLEIFQNDEALNGSTSGADFATANKTGAVQISGRLIPEKDIVEYRGKFYCRPHFIFKFRNEWRDDEKPEQDEGDRE